MKRNIFTPITLFFLVHGANCLASEETSLFFDLSKKEVAEVSVAPGIKFLDVKFTVDKNEFSLVSKLLTSQEAGGVKIATDAILVGEVKGFNIGSLKTIVNDVGKIGKTQFDVGQRVLVEGFPDKETAEFVKNRLGKLSNIFEVRNLSYYPGSTASQSLSILKINPNEFDGKIVSKLANDTIRDTSTVSEIVNENNALAGVNGGYFAYANSLGVVGDPAGVAVVDGKLVSEAVYGRPALLIRNIPHLSVEILPDVTTSMSLSFNGDTVHVDGLNREPGKIFNCGYKIGENLVQSSHDSLCEASNEVVVFNDAFGKVNEDELKNSFSILVDCKNKVVEINPVNLGEIPPSHLLITATGSKKVDLMSLVNEDINVDFSVEIKSNGNSVPINKGDYLINGGPTLLLDGEVQTSRWESEGWSPTPRVVGTLAEHEKDKIASSEEQNQRAAFFDGWVNRRHPRTVVGVSSEGEIYIVVIYGRDAITSAGYTVYEAALLLRSLGAESAINLDGGGSSAMVLNGILTGKPSDKNGERAVAEAILVLSDE